MKTRRYDLLLLLGALLSFASAFGCGGKPQNSGPPDVVNEADYSTPDKETIARFLTIYEQTPYADRSKFVTNPAEYNEAFKACHGDPPVPKKVETTITSIEAGPKVGYLTVKADLRIDGGSEVVSQTTYFDVTKGLRLDFAANSGNNLHGYRQWFVAPDKPITLRVKATLSNMYIYQYEKATETHHSIALEENSECRLNQFHGYVPKDSDLGRRLFAVLQDNKTHPLIITIKYTGSEPKVDVEARFVGIEKLISETWVDVAR